MDKKKVALLACEVLPKLKELRDEIGEDNEDTAIGLDWMRQAYTYANVGYNLWIQGEIKRNDARKKSTKET